MKPLYYLSILALLVVATSTPAITLQKVHVPLSYNYLPGEPFWGKYGTVDSRTIQLWFHPVRKSTLGNFLIENSERVILVGQSDLNDYLDYAFTSVLKHYGISLSPSGTYRLCITPLAIAIGSVDGDEDGSKRCNVELRLDYYNVATSEQLFSAVVRNEGTSNIDDDDDLEYADLLDRTLHGAIVKIWGSQVLFTDSILGNGTIRKVDRGSYTFTPSNLALPYTSPDSLYSESFNASRLYPLEKVTGGTGVLHDSNDTTGTGNIIRGIAGDDTVIVAKGRRISAGILPFENGTGNERLTALVKSAQEHFSTLLSRSGTIRLMERGKLTDILKEQALGLSGIMNDSTVVRVGNLSGLQVMITGEITTTGSYYRMSARIINVETSGIVATASVRVSDALHIAEAGAELAAQLLYKFTEEKMSFNRNSMPYPSISPRAIPAATAATDDAWAVEYNPAAIMKVTMRDVAFYATFAEKLTGTTPDGSTVSTYQPPYAAMGINLAYPVNGFFGTGIGINHRYVYPRINDETDGMSYDYREEETRIVLPVGIGITPRLSLGASLTSTIGEYLTRQTGAPVISGNGITTAMTIGGLFQLSERLRMGATYTSATLYEKSEQTQSGHAAHMIERPSAHYFRFGTAMYPLRWFFFFGDLVYQKYSHLTQANPGFDLGMQLTVYGRPAELKFLPEYGMIPLYIGYSHEPWDRVKNTQAKYFSFGSGYYLNNIYLQWSWRINVEGKTDSNLLLGDAKTGLKLSEYRYRAPLFICIGYRF